MPSAIDIAIQNWALKLAKADLKSRLAAQGLPINVYKVGQTARIMVSKDPQWIELATDKVTRRNVPKMKPKQGGW